MEKEKIEEVCNAYMDRLKTISIYFAEMEEIYHQLQGIQSNLDLAITDIHHDLEFSSLSAAEMMQDTILLKDTLKKRRTVKNCIGIANKVNPGKESFLKLMKEALKIQEEINKGKRYKVRVLKGLKIAQKTIA